MKLPHLIVSSLLWLTLTACSTNNQVGAALGATPTAAESEYLRTEGGGFVFKRGEGPTPKSCCYTVMFSVIKPAGSPYYLRTRFENPADPTNPLVVDSETPRDSNDFTLASPPVHGLRRRHNYKMEILVFDTPERTHQIGTHVQYVQAIVAF